MKNLSECRVLMVDDTKANLDHRLAAQQQFHNDPR